MRVLATERLRSGFWRPFAHWPSTHVRLRLLPSLLYDGNLLSDMSDGWWRSARGKGIVSLMSSSACGAFAFRV